MKTVQKKQSMVPKNRLTFKPYYTAKQEVKYEFSINAIGVLKAFRLIAIAKLSLLNLYVINATTEIF